MMSASPLVEMDNDLLEIIFLLGLSLVGLAGWIAYLWFQYRYERAKVDLERFQADVEGRVAIAQARVDEAEALAKVYKPPFSTQTYRFPGRDEEKDEGRTTDG